MNSAEIHEALACWSQILVAFLDPPKALTLSLEPWPAPTVACRQRLKKRCATVGHWRSRFFWGSLRKLKRVSSIICLAPSSGFTSQNIRLQPLKHGRGAKAPPMPTSWWPGVVCETGRFVRRPTSLPQFTDNACGLLSRRAASVRIRRGKRSN